MTVRLLVKYGTYSQNDLYTGNPTDEAVLLATGQADQNLSLGSSHNSRTRTRYNSDVSIKRSGSSIQLQADGADVNLAYRPRRLAMPVKRAMASSTTANGYSWHSTFVVPFNVIAAKVRLVNAATSTWAGISVILGYSDNVSSVNTPSAGWNAVSFAGASSLTTPVSVGAASAFGGTNSAVDTLLESDVVPVASVARADGAAGSVVHCRLYWATGTGSRASTGSATAPTLANDGYWGGFQATDLVTANQANFTSTTVNPGAAVELVLYTVDGKYITWLAAGDSTIQGFDDLILGGFKRRCADAMNLAGKYINVWDWGASGSTSNGYVLNAIAAIARNPPRILTINSGSPNDADKYTAAGVARQLANISLILDACYANGVAHPVLLTATPETGITQSQEAFRRSLVNGQKSIASALGLSVIDLDAYWTDYDNPAGGFKLALKSGSAAVHPNDVGSAFAGANAAEILSALV